MSQCFDLLTLQAYVDRELAPGPRAAVSGHLAACPRCARVVAGLQAVTAPLQDLEPVIPPDELAERILSAVDGLTAVTPLTCKQACRLASVAADGVLTFAEAEQLEAHLSCCPACRQAAAETQAVTASLRSVPAEPAPADLLSRTLAAVETFAPQTVKRPVVVWRRLALTAAGFAAAAALLFAVFTTSVRPPAPASSVAVTPPAVERVVPAVTPPAPVAEAKPPTALPKPAVASLMERVLHTGEEEHREAETRPRTAPTRVVLLPAAKPARPAALEWHPAPAAPEAPNEAVLPTLAPATPVALAVHGESNDHATVARAAALPRVESPAAAPSGREGEGPTVSHVPSLPAAKAAPAPEVARVAEAPVERRVANWVSRAASDEREVYRAEDRSTRLALARERLDRDVRQYMDSQPREWVIH